MSYRAKMSKRAKWRGVVAMLGLLAWEERMSEAATINILWYTGGVNVDSGTAFTSYTAGLNTLASLAPTSPGGNTWNITQWASGAEPAAPAGGFNVLVVASEQGPWSVSPNYASLVAAAPSITLGSREMVTGQDADWHYMNSPGPTLFNNPQGFLLDAINWAGSGTGLGLVSLGDEGQTGFSFPGITQTSNVTDNVVIPSAVATFPINTNLTSAGLSNWSMSAHDTWTISNTSLWEGINVDGDSTTNYVTVVTAGTAGGGITPPGVPEPSSIVTASIAAVILGAWRTLRRKAKFA
jgi:hypothetical protein